MFLTALITVIGAYLLGSINFAVIFTNHFTHSDVRNQGSGNAGATNAFRAGGTLNGILTFVCDALKGFLAALIGYLIFSYIFKKTGSTVYLPIYGAYVCGVAVMIGHIFPIFFDFRGGKGVSTGFGAFAFCCPIGALAAIIVFAVLVIITKTVSLSSLTATVVLVIVSLILYNKTNGALFLPQAIMSLTMGAIVFIKHIPNIKRLLNGEEKKINLRR